MTGWLDAADMPSWRLDGVGTSPGSRAELGMVRASPNTTHCCSGLPGAPDERLKGDPCTHPQVIDNGSALLRSTIKRKAPPLGHRPRAISPLD